MVKSWVQRINQENALIQNWQIPVLGTKAAQHADGLNKLQAINLQDYDPSAKPFSSGSKKRDKARTAALATDINILQDTLLADKRFKLLVVLQGTDTAGKDGTLRDVFSRTSPLGVRTVGWKAPSSIEQAHDYLWRIHQQVPKSGEIVIFNRSHYEDVLVPTVNGWIDEPTTRQRYRHINDFERLLSETGTVVLKFMLHISKEEQRERLQKRIDDTDKNWKFNMSDVTARKQWKKYQDAYATFLPCTSTPWAPWFVVPSDSKTHRSLMIATIVRDTLQAMQLRYPPANPKLQGMRVV